MEDRSWTYGKFKVPVDTQISVPLYLVPIL